MEDFADLGNRADFPTRLYFVMSEQLDLFKPPETKIPKNRFFIGLFPDEGTARQIVELGGLLRSRHGLAADLYPAHRLHLTLHHLGDYPDVREDVIEGGKRMCRAAAAGTRPFEVEFDRVVSFKGGKGVHPLVLVDHEGNTAVREFYRELLGPLKGGFRPHITLTRDSKQIPEEPVPRVTWMTNELTLIHSVRREDVYRVLGRFPLNG